MKLKVQAIQILMKELQQEEMGAIYFMGVGQEMPDIVTKLNLTKIIQVLCKMLSWIDEESCQKETSSRIINDMETVDIEHAQLPIVKDESLVVNELEKASSVDNKSELEAKDESPMDEDQVPKNLQKHERMKPGKHLFNCSQCEYKSSRSSNLRMHEKIHTGEKPFICSHCAKRFITIAHLKRHERIHTGDKTFCCSYCGYTSKTSGDLKIHERIHTGEKPYSCLKCDKAFAHKNSLKVHERIHMDEKPFSCSQCVQMLRQR